MAGKLAPKEPGKYRINYGNGQISKIYTGRFARKEAFKDFDNLTSKETARVEFWDHDTQGWDKAQRPKEKAKLFDKWFPN